MCKERRHISPAWGSGIPHLGYLVEVFCRKHFGEYNPFNTGDNKDHFVTAMIKIVTSHRHNKKETALEGLDYSSIR